MVVAAVVVGFVVLGWLVSLLGTLLKWALIAGLVVLAVGGVSRLVRARRA
ncbi:hypothetical protein Misp01_17150 [Microtetraspora sp. NBRC 13810]|nr:hypothetical protein Misp01_17150 [Microtetraspora sp. NBRC 13810]